MLFTAIFSIEILFILLALKNFRLATIGLFSLLPIYLVRFSLGPIPFTLLELLLLTWILIGFLKEPKRIFSKKFLKEPFVYASLFFLIFATIGVFVATDKLSALGFWKSYFIEPTLVFFTLIPLLKNKTINVWDLFTGLGISTILLGSFAILQYFTDWLLPIAWIEEMRITSFFDYPNALGLFVAPVVTFFLLTFKHHRLFASIVLFFGILSFLLSQTEAAIIAIPGAIFLSYLLFTPSLKRFISAGITGIIIAGAAFFSSTVQEKILLLDTSGLVRRSQWTETIALLKDHPLLGVGLGGYQGALFPYHNATLYEIFLYPHNIFLNFWVEIGLFGLLNGVLMAIILFIRVYKKPSPLAIALFATLLTMFIHGLVDVPYFKNDLAVFSWAIMAGIFVLTSQTASKNESLDASI